MKSNRRKSKSKPTTLKRGKRGYTRNLGRTPEGIQPKFYLGHDREQAVIREKRLVALWEHIEKYVGMPVKAWTPEYLAAAKAIAKGETPEIPARPYEIADEYVARINELKKEMGAEAISQNDAVYAWGVEQLEGDIEFMIATVDKFAAMPWTGEVGGFFGRVGKGDSEGFYGPCDPTAGRPLPVERLLPPDLVIQDELHLISGPLGTMVGLYETALDELSTVEKDGKRIRPKIIASTATVRRAESQIRALFNRRSVDVFPPPGPDVRNSFFARTHSTEESNARQYLGIAAQGRSPKVIMLRVYLALLAAAQKAYLEAGGKKADHNPADPYMTLLGYFNSLRELGGARRLIEDEVRTQLTARGIRKRLGETEGLFRDRTIAYEVVELTSRVSTDKVSEAKRRLEQPFREKEHVDVAIATNMISVGLDITRLGLMVVFGQPKTSSEYIQATSRVGRDHEKPGLVVTILNVHRPRDRSHYERFAAFHESFYRSVEATSVTPFSPRALDRGLAGTLVSLVRQGQPRRSFAVRSIDRWDQHSRPLAGSACQSGRDELYNIGRVE